MEKRLSVFDIVPMGVSYTITCDRDLPDQVKRFLADKGLGISPRASFFAHSGVLDRIALSDPNSASIYLIDIEGFAWRFKFRRGKWGFVSSNDDETVGAWRGSPLEEYYDAKCADRRGEQHPEKDS